MRRFAVGSIMLIVALFVIHPPGVQSLMLLLILSLSTVGLLLYSKMDLAAQPIPQSLSILPEERDERCRVVHLIRAEGRWIWISQQFFVKGEWVEWQRLSEKPFRPDETRQAQRYERELEKSAKRPLMAS